jgi:hypothetical protein
VGRSRHRRPCRAHHGGNPLLGIVAAIIFTASGIGNLAALRRPHFGGLMLLGAAGLTLADLML